MDEPALLDGIRRATDASAQAFEEVMGGGGAQDLAGRSGRYWRRWGLTTTSGRRRRRRPAPAAAARAAGVRAAAGRAAAGRRRAAPVDGRFLEHGDDAPAAPAKPAKRPSPAKKRRGVAAARAGRPAAAAEPAPAAAPKRTVGEVNKMTVPKLKALTELGLAATEAGLEGCWRRWRRSVLSAVACPKPRITLDAIGMAALPVFFLLPANSALTAVYALPATSILALTLKIKHHCHRHRLVRKTVRT